MENLSSEKGRVTVSWPTRLAFLIRMSMSLIGAVIIVLPRGLLNTGDITLVCLLTEADATESKISHIATLAATTETAPNDTATIFWGLI